MILGNKLPLMRLESRGLAGHDDMSSVLMDLFQVLHAIVSFVVRMPREFPVQSDASSGGAIQRGRMFRGMVAEANGEELLAIGDSDIQARSGHLSTGLRDDTRLDLYNSRDRLL